MGYRGVFSVLKAKFTLLPLVNRTENGIKSIMYIIMTYAIILLVYKQLNDLAGYRHVKAAFMMDILEGSAYVTYTSRPRNRGNI